MYLNHLKPKTRESNMRDAIDKLEFENRVNALEDRISELEYAVFGYSEKEDTSRVENFAP